VERWVAAIVALGLMTGCQSDLGPLMPRDWGLITLDHQAVGGADYTRPQALFYSGLSSPTLSGRGGPDVCGRFAYPSTTVEEPIDEIPAGESVILTMAGTEYSLVATTVGTRRVYSMPEPGIAYRPGDSVRVDIPGAADGFPQMTIGGRTAEPFALGPVDTTASSSDLVTWTPAGDDSSRMVVSVQYHDSQNPGAGLNTQVFCTFEDDGSGTVSPTLLRGWTTATPERRVQAVRWRSVLKAESGAVLYLVSTYAVTKTSFP
jgi:hypothetical protein